MIKKILELVINTEQAENALQGVDKGVQRIDKDLVKTEQEFQKVNKDADQLNKTVKKVPTSTSKVVTGVKKIGIALKGIGIGLLISAIALLKELFESNQKIVDAFAISFEALSIAFNDFFNFVSSNVGSITGFFKSIFDDPLGSVKALGNAIKDSIIERVKSALEVFGFLGKAMQKLFSGDFKGAIDEVKNAGAEFVDVLTGVDNSVEKITEVVSEGVTALTEYTKSTYEQAKANIDLKTSAELATVANQGLIEKFDFLAEKQRQIRDDERKSIEDRKKANNELGIILEKQQAAMLENAQILLRSAQAELKKDEENVVAKKAVMEAENELVAVRAQIAGFRSEQQVNEATLEKEALELINSRLESENNLSIEQKRFNAELIEDELQKLEALKKIDAEEKDLQLKRLQGVIDAANAGTQAKVDAEIAYNETKQELEQQEVTRLAQIEAEKLKIKKEAGEKTINDAKNVAAAEKAIQDAQFNNLESGLSLVKNLASDNKKIQAAALIAENAVGVAKTIINTQAANAAALATPQAVLTSGAAAVPVIAANNIAAGLSIAASVAATAKGLSTLKVGGSPKGDTNPSSSSGGATTSPSQAPSFNVVGQSGFNQVAGALGQQQPVQAFVVSGDVTTAQQLQNNTIQQATF